jgi:hypothetical protein
MVFMKYFDKNLELSIFQIDRVNLFSEKKYYTFFKGYKTTMFLKKL